MITLLLLFFENLPRGKTLSNWKQNDDRSEENWEKGEEEGGDGCTFAAVLGSSLAIFAKTTRRILRMPRQTDGARPNRCNQSAQFRGAPTKSSSSDRQQQC
ncbi:hypothetical protein niasHT_008134 [Heterodera trifolii]|uniref:Secreted protein n=1 Tax=Heterodera trifolii TaxID=157864 RepID=A0ABD2M032_9BILA